MPIIKESTSRLVHFGYSFEAIPRQVVELITNPVALAYYTYLLTRPDEWIVRRGHLMERFGVGRERHDAAMAQLRDLGLAWVEVERDAAGRITDRKFLVGAIPVDGLQESPKVGKPTIRENPQVGKTDHLNIYRVIKDKQKSDQAPEGVDPQVWGKWVEYNKSIKKKMTQPRVNRHRNVLAPYPPEIQDEIVERSIASGWSSVFAPKGQAPARNQGSYV